MLEIFLLWRLTKYIGNITKSKGYSAIGFQIGAVVLWIIGEFFGLIFGALIFGSSSSIGPDYLVGLIGAVIGAGIAFLIVNSLPQRNVTKTRTI